MEQIKDTLFYDGSFNGFLTLLYEVQERSLTPEGILKKQDQQEVLFIDAQFIPTELKKARSVWNSLRNKNYGSLKNLYFAFLSEEQDIEWKLFQFYQRLAGNVSMENKEDLMANSLYIEQLANLVEKEKLIIERKLFIDHLGDGPCIKTIQPTYNVLPLISKFFRTRYKEQEWVIYDSKRNYGLHHRNGTIAFTSLSPDQLAPLFSEHDYGSTTLDHSLKISSQEPPSLKKRAQKSRHIQAVA
jgi:probable DNA metabolism protein